MIFLLIICCLMGGALFQSIREIKKYKKDNNYESPWIENLKTKTPEEIDKELSNSYLWFIGCLIVCIICFTYCLGSSTNSSSSRWNNLTPEQKQWYKDNYGDGQYDEYREAIDDYKKTH